MIAPIAHDLIPSAAAPATSPEILAAWIAAGAAVVAALIAGIFGWTQQRRTRRLELEKVRLEDQLTRERTQWQDARAATAERERADEEFQDRLRADAERADAQGRYAIEYRLKIVERYRRLKILDMTKPLDLEELYVQLRVREEEAPRYVTEAEIAELTQGEPERLLRLSQERLRTGTASAVSPDEALKRFRRIAVLGDPGAGKTTMLRYLTFRIAREELTPGLTVPVYVELRGFVDSPQFDIECDLIAYVAADWQRRYGFPAAQPYIERELAAGRAALLLDGLDEVLGGTSSEVADAAYRKVTAEIDLLADRFPGAPIAVTCRRAGWRGRLAQFQTLEVLDFDWAQIQTFIDHWFTGDPTKAQGLRDALSANLRMQTLAANPLLLSLIAIVYQRELELPERRAELYNRCVEVLLKDWDAHRDIKRFSQFTTDRKRDLLEEVAWHFHQKGLRYFPEQELLEIIGAFLPTIDLDPGHARDIRDEIAAQYGLLKVQAHGWYGFLHLTLQEYFAAVAAAERGRPAIAEVATRRDDPWWEEVILLLAGRLTDASPLLLALLGRDPGSAEPPPETPLAADDDIFHNDLFLAARCLIGTPRLRTTWLRARIIADVRRLLLDAPLHRIVQRAAQILAEIGGTELRTDLLTLVADGDLPAPQKVAIIAALGDVGDTAAAPRLLTIFQQHDRPDEIGAAIAETLGKLHYAPAVSTLLDRALKMVQEGTQSYTAMRAMNRVAAALGALGDPSVKPTLWSLINRQDFHDWPISPVVLAGPVHAIGQLGDEADISPLFDLLPSGFSESIVAAIVRLGGETTAPRLFALLRDTSIATGVFPTITWALRDLKSPAILPAAITCLRDAGIDWKARWLVTEMLEGYPPEACEAELLDLVSDPNVDDKIRIGIAATLTVWGNPAGLDRLRAAFDHNTLPSALRFRDSGGYSYPVSSWRRVAAALHRLDDDSVVPTLVARYKDALTSGNSALAGGLEDALISFRRVESIREIPAPYKHRWTRFADALTKSTLPLAFDLLATQDAESTTRYVINALGKIADDAESANRLLHLLTSTIVPHINEEFEDALIDALAQVCQRARVRAFADGRIVPITT